MLKEISPIVNERLQYCYDYVGGTCPPLSFALWYKMS